MLGIMHHASLIDRKHQKDQPNFGTIFHSSVTDDKLDWLMTLLFGDVINLNYLLMLFWIPNSVNGHHQARRALAVWRIPIICFVLFHRVMLNVCCAHDGRKRNIPPNIPSIPKKKLEIDWISLGVYKLSIQKRTLNRQSHPCELHFCINSTTHRNAHSKVVLDLRSANKHASSIISGNNSQ